MSILGIVMEFIDGEDLQAYLLKQGGSLSEDVARFVFQQLCITVCSVFTVFQHIIIAEF